MTKGSPIVFRVQALVTISVQTLVVASSSKEACDVAESRMTDLTGHEERVWTTDDIDGEVSCIAGTIALGADVECNLCGGPLVKCGGDCD